MVGNFGMGLGSFLSGLSQGAQAYSNIQTAKSQNKLNEMRLNEAESNLAEKTRQQDLQADANRIGKIGLENAQTIYGDDVKAVINHYNTNTVPKQQQFWIENGDVDKAEMLGKFIETKQAQQLTENSALAIKQAGMGDYQNLGKTIESLLGVSSSVTGGQAMKLKGMTELKDDKGQKTGGVSFKFAGADGKDQDISFNNTSELIGFIRNNAMPDKIVEYAYDQEQQAQKVKAENAKSKRDWKQKQAEKGLDFKFQTARDENLSSLKIGEQKSASGLRMQEETNKAQLKNAYGGSSSEGSKKIAEAQATIEFLKSNGVSDEYIQQNITAIAGLENKSRPMSSRVDDYIKMRSGADMGFAKLTPNQQVAQAKEYIKEVDKTNGGGTVDNPFQQKPQSQSKGMTPYLDTKTGAVVYR